MENVTRLDVSVVWTGECGVQYRYWLADLETDLPAGPGNYMLLRETGTGTYEPLLIGESEALEYAIHSSWTDPVVAEALAAGATHVCIHQSDGGRAARAFEVHDLIAAYMPELHRSAA